MARWSRESKSAFLRGCLRERQHAVTAAEAADERRLCCGQGPLSDLGGKILLAPVCFHWGAFVAKIVTLPCGPQVNQSGLSQNKLQALALRLQVWP